MSDSVEAGPPTPPHESRFQNHEKSVPVQSEAERKQALRAEAAERLRVLADPNVDNLTHTRTLIVSLIHWDTPLKSGIALFGSLTILIVSSYFNPLRLAAGLWSLLIFGNLVYVHSILQYKRITGKSAANPHEQRMKATENGLLEKSVVDRWVVLAVDTLNLAAQEVGRIVLIEDTSRSLAAFGWGLLVYVISGWFSTRWILGIAIVATFTLPKGYIENKTLVDEHVAKANVIIREQTGKAQVLAQKHASPYLDKATALGQQYGIVGKSKGE